MGTTIVITAIGVFIGAVLSGLATLIGAFVGAVLSVLATLFIEFMRAPKLTMTAALPDEKLYREATAAGTATWLRVTLQNKPLPQWFQWLIRAAAVQCHGYIDFYDRTTGTAIFQRSMPIRWAYSDEPYTDYPAAGGTTQRLFDPAKYNAASIRNCYTGQDEDIDVVARYLDDPECYGWSNETYWPVISWRKPDWRIPRGTYLVNVTVSWAAGKETSAFVLDNSQGRDKFRLLPPTSQDLALLGLS